MVRLYFQFRGWKQLRENREGTFLRFWLIVLGQPERELRNDTALRAQPTAEVAPYHLPFKE